MNRYHAPATFYRPPTAPRLTQPLPRRLPIEFPDLDLPSAAKTQSRQNVAVPPGDLLSPIFYLPSARCHLPSVRLRTLSPFSLLPSPRFALQNAAGFWELVLDGRYAILPQNQGLFYIAWLFAQPFGERIRADQFAGKVDDTFAWHHDFAQDMPWLRRHLDIKQIQANLTRKQTRLEKILDDPSEPDVIKNEANHQLIEIYEERRNILTDSKGTAQTISEIVFANIYSVYATLAAACDYAGNPHPVARPFARHLLLYLLIPSIRATGPSRVTTFVYRPPAETAWSRWDAIPNL